MHVHQLVVYAMLQLATAYLKRKREGPEEKEAMLRTMKREEVG